MEDKKKQGISWTAVLIALVIAAAILLYPMLGNLTQTPAPAEVIAANPAPVAAVEETFQQQPLITNHNNIVVENNQVIEPAIAPAVPAAPEKGTATNPFSLTDLAKFVKTNGNLTFSGMSASSGTHVEITWNAVPFVTSAGVIYADLTNVQNRWVGPLPVISVMSTCSGTFQQAEIEGVCFTPFK